MLDMNLILSPFPINPGPGLFVSSSPINPESARATILPDFSPYGLSIAAAKMFKGSDSSGRVARMSIFDFLSIFMRQELLK